MTWLRLAQGCSSCGFADEPGAGESHRWLLGIPDVELMSRHGQGLRVDLRRCFQNSSRRRRSFGACSKSFSCQPFSFCLPGCQRLERWSSTIEERRWPCCQSPEQLVKLQKRVLSGLALGTRDLDESKLPAKHPRERTRVRGGVPRNNFEQGAVPRRC